LDFIRKEYGRPKPTNSASDLEAIVENENAIRAEFCFLWHFHSDVEGMINYR
jgi:hypothetical protein